MSCAHYDFLLDLIVIIRWRHRFLFSGGGICPEDRDVCPEEGVSALGGCLPRRGSAQGGSLPRGVSTRGVSAQCMLGYTPHEQNDRHL